MTECIHISTFIIEKAPKEADEEALSMLNMLCIVLHAHAIIHTIFFLFR